MPISEVNHQIAHLDSEHGFVRDAVWTHSSRTVMQGLSAAHPQPQRAGLLQQWLRRTLLRPR